MVNPAIDVSDLRKKWRYDEQHIRLGVDKVRLIKDQEHNEIMEEIQTRLRAAGVKRGYDYILAGNYMSEIFKDDYSFRKRQELGICQPKVVKSSARTPLNDKEIDYLLDRLQGLNHPLAASIIDKLKTPTTV